MARLSGWAAKKHNQNVLEPPGRPPQGMEEGEGAAGPPEDNSYMRSVSRPRCDNCLGHHAGGRGNVAICNETEREKNLKMLLGQTSSISRDRVIASEILNKVGDAYNNQASVTFTSGRCQKLTVTTGGKYAIQAQKQREPFFTNEDLNKLQLALGSCSDKQMLTIGHYLRVECGRGSVVKHKEYMQQRNHILDDLFDVASIPQTIYVTDDDNGDGKKKKRKTVQVLKTLAYCNNIQQLIVQMVLYRDLDTDNLVVQIGIDHGGNWLKVMLTVKPRHEPISLEPKRRSYEDGFLPTKFKLGGAKKLITLGLIKSCERHDNMQEIMNHMGIETIDYGLSIDLKMTMFLLGKMGCSSKFSCPFCLDCDPWLDPNSPSLTLGLLWADYHGYREAEEKRIQQGKKTPTDAKLYHNVVNKPLLQGPDDEKILGNKVLIPVSNLSSLLIIPNNNNNNSYS